MLFYDVYELVQKELWKNCRHNVETFSQNLKTSLGKISSTADILSRHPDILWGDLYAVEGVKVRSLLYPRPFEPDVGREYLHRMPRR